MWVEDAPFGSHAAPTPAKRGHAGRNIFLALVLLVVVIVVVSVSTGSSKKTASPGGVLSTSTNTKNPPIADITIASCATDGVGIWHAKGTVLNHSSKPSDYDITVALNDATTGARLGTADDFLKAISAGQSAALDATSLDDIPKTATVKCVPLTVDRTESTG